MRYFGDQWEIPGVAKWLRIQSNLGSFDGRRSKVSVAYLDSCRAAHVPSGSLATLSRDERRSANVDTERCLHLALSFRDPATGGQSDRDPQATRLWLEAVFGDLVRLVWSEPPYVRPGQWSDLWHYRLFYAPGWEVPILPRGKNDDFKAAGWIDWDDLQAVLAEEEQELEEDSHAQA